MYGPCVLALTRLTMKQNHPSWREFSSALLSPKISTWPLFFYFFIYFFDHFLMAMKFRWASLITAFYREFIICWTPQEGVYRYAALVMLLQQTVLLVLLVTAVSGLQEKRPYHNMWEWDFPTVYHIGKSLVKSGILCVGLWVEVRKDYSIWIQ